MANVRRHIRFSWAGGDPVDVVTNARDIADASELAGDNAALAGFALAFCAARRNGVQVPPWEAFLDQLDTLSTGANGEAVGPTQQQASTVAPSP